MLVAGSNMHEINSLKKQLSQEFEMKDLGAANQILGMRISRENKTHIEVVSGRNMLKIF